MTAIRPSLTSMAQNSVYDLENSMSRLQDLQNQLASGKAITVPSDNPGGTVQALSYQAGIERATQYGRNAADGLGWLGQADSTLSDVQTLLQRANTLAVQGANGATDTAGRNAIADEIDSIRQSILADGNATYLNRPLFGGTTGSPTAYDANGNYLGDSGAVSRTVNQGVTVQVNMTGPQVFGAGASSVFSALGQLSADLRSGNTTAISTTDLNALHAATTTVADAQAIVGSRYNQVQAAQSAVQSSSAALQSSLASVADVDFAKATTDFQLQQITYQAALKATSMIIQPSLASFLQ